MLLSLFPLLLCQLGKGKGEPAFFAGCIFIQSSKVTVLKSIFAPEAEAGSAAPGTESWVIEGIADPGTESWVMEGVAAGKGCCCAWAELAKPTLPTEDSPGICGGVCMIWGCCTTVLGAGPSCNIDMLFPPILPFPQFTVPEGERDWEANEVLRDAVGEPICTMVVGGDPEGDWNVAPSATD